MLFHPSNSILASKGEENAEFLAKMATGNVLIALGLNFRDVLRCCSSDTQQFPTPSTKNLQYITFVAALLC